MGCVGKGTGDVEPVPAYCSVQSELYCRVGLVPYWGLFVVQYCMAQSDCQLGCGLSTGVWLALCLPAGGELCPGLGSEWN